MIRVQTRLFAAPTPSLSRLVQLWGAVARQRSALARLDNDALTDIGLTRDEAQREAARPFWDAPDNWRF